MSGCDVLHVLHIMSWPAGAAVCQLLMQSKALLLDILAIPTGTVSTIL
jgi:hypothetical protein